MKDLPSPNTKKWTKRCVSSVVYAVRTGLLTEPQACDRYNISVEEHFSWQKIVDEANLPADNTTRWVTRRKAAVVYAVQNGLLTEQEACDRYNISVEEFLIMAEFD
jgi:hypothetical protein